MYITSRQIYQRHYYLSSGSPSGHTRVDDQPSHSAHVIVRLYCAIAIMFIIRSLLWLSHNNRKLGSICWYCSQPPNQMINKLSATNTPVLLGHPDLPVDYINPMDGRVKIMWPTRHLWMGDPHDSTNTQIESTSLFKLSEFSCVLSPVPGWAPLVSLLWAPWSSSLRSCHVLYLLSYSFSFFYQWKWQASCKWLCS